MSGQGCEHVVTERVCMSDGTRMEKGFLRVPELSDVYPYMAENYINDTLPEEIILKIFSYLDVRSLSRCARVCKKWSCLATDGTLWRRVSLYPHRKRVKDRVVRCLAQRAGVHLKGLDMTLCQFSPRALSAVVDHCPNIRVLNMDTCNKMNDKTIIKLSQRCGQLLKLDIRNVLGMTDRSLLAISEGCRKLKTVNISGCPDFTDRAVVSLVQSCPAITRLYASELNLQGETIKQIALSLPTLEALDIRKNENRSITEETIITLASQCRRLTILRLGGCTGLTKEAMEALGKGCPSLRWLDITGCMSFRDDGIAAFVKNCKTLEILTMQRCLQVSTTTVRIIAKHCCKLTTLDLSFCRSVTCSALNVLGKSDHMCRTLHTLKVNGCWTVQFDRLTDLHRLTALRRLEMADMLCSKTLHANALRSRCPCLVVVEDWRLTYTPLQLERFQRLGNRERELCGIL